MARKPVDLKAAKAAKQKKIAIGGGVLLVALLAFSIPRTLKMLHHSPQASSMHHVRSSQGTPGSSTAPSSALPPGVPSNVVSTAGTTGTTVLTAQLAPPARQGQLSSLSKSFNSKDPFEQLIDDSAVSDSGQTPPADTTAKPTKPGPELKVVPNATAPASAPAPVVQAAPKAKKVVLPFLSAVISVNGVRWGVNVKLDFPSDAPLFTLVSLKKGTAKVSVAGGSLANGAPTLTLRRGKPVTLVNTADGTRYRLVLVSLSTASAATPPTEDAAAAGQTSTSTTPAQTTTTQTTTTGPTLGG